MFDSLIQSARRATSRLIATYLGRAAVAVPFLVAAVFATVALTLALIEQFGHQLAYWLLALGFTLVGLLAAVVVGYKEQEAAAAPAAPAAEDESTDPMTVAQNVLAPAAILVPILTSLSTSPIGMSATLKIGKWALRNIPLLVLAALAAAVLWPTERPHEETAASAPDVPAPDVHPAG